MAPHIINALISTFPGLPNFTLPLPSSTSISTLHSALLQLLPPTPRLLLSTTSGHILRSSSPTPISTLAGTHDFLTLRLSVALPGGKGGFGSQLRAAGGRMSSRKKRGQQENNDSCRNLDGRRMRTVKEAKALAAYLEIKPEMERAERARRRERAEKVVAAAEKGPGRGGGRFTDIAWLEETEEERERTREAVVGAMKLGFTDRTFTGGSGSGSGSGSGGSSGSGSDEGAGTTVLRFAGWDEDDEFMSDDDEEMADIKEEEEEDEIKREEDDDEVKIKLEDKKSKGKGKGKGKGKARA